MALPAGVPQGAFGARLMALIALCTAKFRMSKKSTQEFFFDVLGIHRARTYVCSQAAINMDETSYRYSSYSWYDSALRQICWAHLERDFQAILERGGEKNGRNGK